MSMTLDSDNALSLDRISRLRSEAHATIRHYAAVILSLSSAITDVDAALMLTIAERSIDESQALVDAARRLVKLLEGSAVPN